MSMQDIADPFTPGADSKRYRAMWQFWHPIAYSKDVAEGGKLSRTLLGGRVLLDAMRDRLELSWTSVATSETGLRAGLGLEF